MPSTSTQLYQTALLREMTRVIFHAFFFMTSAIEIWLCAPCGCPYTLCPNFSLCMSLSRWKPEDLHPQTGWQVCALCDVGPPKDALLGNMALQGREKGTLIFSFKTLGCQAEVFWHPRHGGSFWVQPYKGWAPGHGEDSGHYYPVISFLLLDSVDLLSPPYRHLQHYSRRDSY